jgi:hypothetical protein
MRPPEKLKVKRKVPSKKDPSILKWFLFWIEVVSSHLKAMLEVPPLETRRLLAS